MTSRWLRGTVFAALVVALASVAAMIVDGERRLRAEVAAAATVEQTAQRAIAVAHDTRASQQAYVAVAQSPDWWHGRLASHVDALRGDLTALRQLCRDPGALNDLDAATASLDAFAQVDERALRMVLAERNADASLLVFSDGLEAISTVVQRIESARAAETTAAAARTADERLAQGYAVAAGAVVAVLVSLFLLATGPASPPAAVEVAQETRPIEVAAVPTSEPEPIADPPADATAPSDQAAPLPDRRSASDLHEAASLCTDFARVNDARELPGLLARAAALLEAKGLIVWLADPDRSTLRPSLAHGYPAAAVARLSSLHRDDDNATAACFTRAALDSVAGDGSTPGAIVAPLLTASGCVGVLAAEVLNGRETSEPTRALMRILAAQIATLVGGGPAREEIAPGQEAMAQ